MQNKNLPWERYGYFLELHNIKGSIIICAHVFFLFLCKYAQPSHDSDIHPQSDLKVPIKFFDTLLKSVACLHRPSAIWPVSEAAMKASASGRVETLSEPKALHRDYQPCRQVQTVVSEAAMKTEPSQRVEVLAQHKTYAPLKIKSNSQWDWSEWESDLTEAAKNATASERVLVLSNPKLPHRSYKEGRPVIWEVSQSAQKALPSLRVQQLARPKSRSQYNEDYDPNAWKVSQGAKSAQATPRIAELAMPIPRKVRTKKVV